MRQLDLVLPPVPSEAAREQAPPRPSSRETSTQGREAVMVWKPVWNERCSEILRRNAQHYTNSEIAAEIEAATGLRFSVPFVSRRRAALGLDCPLRNDWSAPVNRRKWLRRLSARSKRGRQ
jgi:hypothetical protein